MDSVLNVVRFLEDFWINGTEFLAQIFQVHNFGFISIEFLQFFTAGTLTLFLAFAIAKWILS